METNRNSAIRTPAQYERRVQELEAEGCSRSDAQAVADAEIFLSALVPAPSRNVPVVAEPKARSAKRAPVPHSFLIYIPALHRNIRAYSIEDAVAEFCALRDSGVDCDGFGYGASDIGCEFALFECDGTRVGQWRIGSVFYNGRVELRVQQAQPNQATRVAAAKRAARAPGGAL